MLNHQSIDSYSCRGCDTLTSAYECALCSFLCDSESVFRSHLNTEHKSNFLPCIYCETLYNAPHFLLRHLKSTHVLGAKVYCCGSVECSFKTIILKKFVAHLNLCTAGKAIKCYYCKSTFATTNLLILHMQKKLKIVVNKAYSIDKIIRIVPSPVPVLQTHLSVGEPKISFPSNLVKTERTNDDVPKATVTDHSTPYAPVSAVSPSKNLSYILPKSVGPEHLVKTVKTYSVVAPLQAEVEDQDISVTRNVSIEKNKHVFQKAVVLPVSHKTGNTSTLILGGNVVQKPVHDASVSEKFTNTFVHQISPPVVSTLRASNMPEIINKTAVRNNNMPTSDACLENESLKSDTSSDMGKETKLITLPVIRVDSPMKGIIPSSKTQYAVFPKPSVLSVAKNETSLPVSAKALSQSSVLNKNTSNLVTYPKHSFKIPSKIMLIPVPQPPPVYTLLPPEFSKSHACTNVSASTGKLSYTLPNMNASSSAKSGSAMIQSLHTGTFSQVGCQSSLSVVPSSMPCELGGVSKNNSNCNLGILHGTNSETTLVSSGSVLNSFPAEHDASLHKNPLETSSYSLAVDENCVKVSSTVSVPFCAPATCSSCNVTVTDTEPSESGAVLSEETEDSDKAELSHFERYDNCENTLPLKPVDLVSNLCASLLSSQKGRSASVQATSDCLNSAFKQNSSITKVPELVLCSVGSQSTIVSPITAPINKELTSPFCTSKTSSASTPVTFVTYIKQEVISSCDLQCEKSLPKYKRTSHEKICNKFNDYYGDIAAVVSNHNLLSQRDSSLAVSDASDNLISPAQQNIRVTVTSQNGSPSYCIPGTPVLLPMHTTVKEELASPHFSCPDSREISSVSPSPISLISIKEEVISDSDDSCQTPPLSPIVERAVSPTSNPVSSFFNVKSEASCCDHNLGTVSSVVYEAPTVYIGTSSFRSVTSSLPSHFAGSTVLVNKDAVCDVTFTTLAIRPESTLNSSLPRTMSSSVMDTMYGNENSMCELQQCSPVTLQQETLTGNEICCDFESDKLIIDTSAVDCMPAETSYEVQFGDHVSTVVSSGINDKTSVSSCMSQNSTSSSLSICDSQHSSSRHSTCSSVTLLSEIVSKGQSVYATAYDNKSSHIHIDAPKSNIPCPILRDVAFSELSTSPLLPETTEGSASKYTSENLASCNTPGESKSSPSASSSSGSVDDRHPFLNSTNMTVRQILEKFRGKYKGASRKSSLRIPGKTCKNVKDLRKQCIQCSTDSQNSHLGPTSTAVAPSVNKTVLMTSDISHELDNTEVKAGEDVPVVPYKRKASEVLEMDIVVENPTPKIQEIDEQVTSSCDRAEEHPFVHFTSEHGIKREVLPSYINEQSIKSDVPVFDQYCFSELEDKALSDGHSTEEMCAGTDILQVARELLSYSDTPEEIVGELTDILQALKQKKSEKALQEMFKPSKLKDFFKCMGRQCSYTSHICVNFSNHLKKHDAYLWECAYCFMDFPARDNLICHLMQEHKKSLFQCSLCFYRAYSQTQVCIHFRRFHSCEKGHIITCLPVDTYPISNFKENHMMYYADITKPYSCCFCDCSFSCIAILDVIHHILYCHPVCFPYVCKECKKQNSDIFEWLIHCQLHGIHLFHCIYCTFGAETRADILYHISMYHANESLVVFVRSSRYLMVHLEHVLKYGKAANVKKFCDFFYDSSLLAKDEFGIEVQVILENTFHTGRTLKCLYCLCSAEHASEMQTHLYSKHSQNDIMHYYFCQSHFQVTSEANFIFESLLTSEPSNQQNTACTDKILPEKDNLIIDQPNVPLQIKFLETPDGVVNLQVPLAVFRQKTFGGKYKRTLESLYNQIQSRIQKKRFKCLYCKKTERHLYKLRQHWRSCHVQTGKKFKYELINKKMYEVAKNSSKTCIYGNAESLQDMNSNSTLCVHSCSAYQFCACSHKNVNNNWESFGAPGQAQCSQCDGSLKIMDTFSHHELGCDGYSSHCHNSCNSLQSTKVPSEKEHSSCKCNCMFKIGSCTICQTSKQYCAETTGSQMTTYEVKLNQIQNQRTGMHKNYRLKPPCYCSLKCSKKARCFKNNKSGGIGKHHQCTSNVKLKVFLRKLPYSVKLPVLYLKEIINLDPVVVLSDVKRENRMK